MVAVVPAGLDDSRILRTLSNIFIKLGLTLTLNKASKHLLFDWIQSYTLQIEHSNVIDACARVSKKLRLEVCCCPKSKNRDVMDTLISKQ